MIEFLSQNATIIGLIFFFSFFTVMALWVFRPGKKDSYQDHANIPLREQAHEQ